MTSVEPKPQNKYFQVPNLPLIVWFVALLLARVTAGQWHALFSVVSFGALFTWAWLEIFHGTNMFRRILGVVVMSLTIINKL
ncbi:hypothetical protein A3F37_00400 [Candidatus Saccharibacteria bacterium RIFCSPHIGHO2_12_FULL_41_12]|nr:MAG: hypothetical protein A3F37_00400 [Candidatus Saccharibacteria bacterium RIFCSPHIGHO2_12_FULL_41_12]